MFFDRPGSGERALLVHCAFRGDELTLASANAELEDVPTYVSEFVDLARSAGVSPVYLAQTRRSVPTANYFIGGGKVDEICDIIREHSIDVVLFNHALSPSQERNLEKRFECKVLDRTGLILDIFAQRARSHVGKLQVELAQLEHISTRLVRGWTHLERQKGGIGLRGPGESQLETDRRLLRERVKWLNKRLDKVNAQQLQSKRGRQRAEIPTIALVGYTNAGKSTLFNALTQADVYAKDQLFATLDTTLRARGLPNFGKVVFADTVGFVRDLPHKLVEAFKATLEEAAHADLLLHVVDASAAERDEQIAACESVLNEIGAGDIPSLLVMNKLDAIETIAAPRIDRKEGRPYRVWLSAKQADGIDLLDLAVAECIGTGIWSGQVCLDVSCTKLRSELFTLGAVMQEDIGESGEYRLKLSYQERALSRLFEENGLDLAVIGR